MNNNLTHSFWKRVRITLATIALISLASSPMSKAQAQAWTKLESDGVMVTIGITDDGKYPVYQLKVDKNTQKTGRYPSDGYVFSTEELPQYMIRIQPSDVNRNGYKCNFFCHDKYGNLVGLNPERVKAVAWDTTTIPPVDHEKKYLVYPIHTEDLDDLFYMFRSIKYDHKAMMTAIPPIRKEDVNRNGYKCEFLCANQDGKIVGWNPLDKRIGKY